MYVVDLSAELKQVKADREKDKGNEVGLATSSICLICILGQSGHYPQDADLSTQVRASDYIKSIHDVACCVRSKPVAVYNLLYSVSCRTLCQMCVCVLSSAWWSSPSGSLTTHCIQHCTRALQHVSRM